MKSLFELLELTPADRAKALKKTASAAKNGARLVAKILVAAELKDDLGDESLNAYAQRITGLDIRRELQGTYEAVNVLKALRKSEIPLSEETFDNVVGFALVVISGLMSKAPEKVAEACAIATEGTDVVKRLKELKAGPKKTKAEKPGGGEGAETKAPEIQTPGEEISPLDAFLEWLGDTPILGLESIRDRIAADVHGAATQKCCEGYVELFGKFKASAESRWEKLEAEAEEIPAAAAAAA